MAEEELRLEAEKNEYELRQHAETAAGIGVALEYGLRPLGPTEAKQPTRVLVWDNEAAVAAAQRHLIPPVESVWSAEGSALREDEFAAQLHTQCVAAAERDLDAGIAQRQMADTHAEELAKRDIENVRLRKEAERLQDNVTWLQQSLDASFKEMRGPTPACVEEIVGLYTRGQVRDEAALSLSLVKSVGVALQSRTWCENDPESESRRKCCTKEERTCTLFQLISSSRCLRRFLLRAFSSIRKRFHRQARLTRSWWTISPDCHEVAIGSTATLFWDLRRGYQAQPRCRRRHPRAVRPLE